jgi:hypothetical protein
VGGIFGGTLDGAPERAREVQTWPRIDAPHYQPALVPFDVVVGFGDAPQPGTDRPARLPVKPGAKTIDVTVELAAGRGVEAPQGWSRPMQVPVDAPASAHVTFRLVGTEPPEPHRPWLTMLEVRYVVDGTVCATAARPLAILPAGAAAGPQDRPFGLPWHAMPPVASRMALQPDDLAPDLTIEITKPDRNAASGHYVCTLYSPHALQAAHGPFDVDLGQDARSLARQIVDEVRMYAANPLLDNALESIGRLVATRLPAQAFSSLAEVARRIAPAVPTVLIVSSEPYVPWELAWMDAPLDASRPSYLGAQALVGRWLRDDAAATPAAAELAGAQRPATHPNARMAVRHMAVMAAWYKPEAGLRRLPKAEDEAKSIAQSCRGVPLAASADAMRRLLNGTVDHQFETIGRVQAVHFAGHGDFDPGRPDGSALFLADGTPLRSTLFRSARYGGPHQPLIFLNACMLGIGGELLGDMGGFPGNSLRGGFGAVLGALWEVDDAVAHDIALEFWKRALPEPPARGEPVAAILRDLRARYAPDAAAGADAVPVSTYLAYVYYGHPRLTLERAAA